jgi:hypothetical protein
MMNTLISLLGLFSLIGAIVVLLLGVYLLVNRKRRRQMAHPTAKRVPPTIAIPPAQPLTSVVPDVMPTTARPNVPLPYARTATLLSTAEQEFFTAALRAIPSDMLLFPQVRLAGLVHTTERQPQRKKYDFYRIQAKTVDFVLCDARTTTPRLVIELDDSSHHRAERQKRDDFVDDVLASVGLPILHVRWSPNYDVERIRAAIFGQLGMVAPPPPAPRPLPTPISTRPVLPTSTIIHREPPRISETPILAGQQVVDAIPQSAQIVCGTCRAPVSAQSKYCMTCGTALG